MWRYIRAFFLALAMTVRGETPQTPAQKQYPRLFEWMARAQTALDAVFEVAGRAGFDEAARKAVALTVDGRETSVETLLQGIRYHLREEYPYVLRHLTEYSLTGVYAANINDAYWVRTMSEAENVPDDVQASLVSLAEVLEGIPPSNDLGPRNTSD
jgi:hypothetical protein